MVLHYTDANKGVWTSLAMKRISWRPVFVSEDSHAHLLPYVSPQDHWCLLDLVHSYSTIQGAGHVSTKERDREK